MSKPNHSQSKEQGPSTPDRFEAMVESAQDSIISIDSAGNISYWNGASERIFGYSRETVLGQPITIIIPERYRTAHASGMTRVRDSGHSNMSGSTVELVGQRADGTEFPLEMSLSHFHRDGLMSFTSVIRDISEKKASSDKILLAQTRAEQELQRRILAEDDVRRANEQLESRVIERTLELEQARDLAIHHEQRTQSILKQIPAAIATIRASDLVYTSVNPQYSLLHGDRPLLGHSIYDLLPSSESKHYIQKLNDVITSGQSFQINEASRQVDRHGNGVYEELIVNLFYDPVCDSEGVVVEILIFCFDVTELVMGRREIEKREARFRSLSETVSILKNRADAIIQDAPVLLWAINQEGIFNYYDGKVKNILGIRTEDRIGLNILELYRDYPAVADNVKRALQGETVHGESQIGSISLENKFTPQFDQDGKVTGVIGLSVDITERKKAEQGYAEASITARIAQESSKLKSEFLANMSHEIRTPINGVIGMSGLLLDLVSRDEEKSYVLAIQRSGENLLSLVNDILDFSKIEAGKLDFEEKPFALSEVVLGLQQTLAFTIEAKGLKLEFQIGERIPKLILGDSGRFRQVLLNLISNAIKFTKVGTIQVRMDARALGPNQTTLRVEVNDSGIGISPETLTRLFQPFIQADASTARSYGGSGLGLSISKSLVERMGGQIGAISDLGIGSTFWFTAQFQIVEESSLPSSSVTSSAATETLSARILVAEDNGINQIIAIKMLEKMGFAADVVANGFEVLDALDAKPYDLILMDCQMPEMDGYEATRVIRSRLQKEYSNIPIIAMTANAMRGDAEKCLACGMSDYISKPVKPADLLETIRRNILKIQEKTA